MFGTIARKAGKRLVTRLLDRAGSLVGRVVDTSADAPDSRFVPKRDLYAKMNAAPEPEAPEEDHGHDHDHGHAHDH